MTDGLSTRTLDRFSPEALFVVSGIAQYTGAVIAVSLFDEVPPATVAWFRVIGAAAILLAISHRRHRGWTRAELVAAMIFGVATALMNMFFYLGIDRIALGKSVVIEFIGPVAVAAAFTRTSRNTVALLFAVAGVLVLGGVEIDSEPLGLLFILGASAMWAAYIVVGRRVASSNRGVAGLGLGLAVGAVAIAPFGAPDSGPVWTTPSLLGSALLVGVFSSALGYGIDQHVMRRIPVRRFALLLALLPVTALIVGFIALDQRPSTVELGGVVLVILGVIIQERDEMVIDEHTPAEAITIELEIPPG